MRELISDFNICYYKVLHALVAQDVLKEKLTREEWDEYLEYLRYVNGEVSDMETGRRIDLIGAKHTLYHKAYGRMDVYDLGDRLLYPAYDVGRSLNLAHPSAMGSGCSSRESWRIRVKRCTLKNGMPSYQVLRKNFIAAEDVRRLAKSSGDPWAAEICEWILSLES